MKKILVIIFIAFLAVFCFIIAKKYLGKSELESLGNIPIVEQEKEEIIAEKPELVLEGKETEEKLPEKILIDVPFLSQAPYKIWDVLHEDACEEASLIMVKYFSDEEKAISAEKGEKEIQDLIAFEKKNKYNLSITLDELNSVADEYYKMKTGRVKKNIGVEDIKKELAEGRPVIVGAAGKVLPNPNFKNGGPNYHMLVITGYDENGFITNDPGTRLGEDFKYTFNDLYQSIHDWDPKDILDGEKNYLVFD